MTRVEGPQPPLTRRGFLQVLGGTALATGAATLASGCSRPEAPSLMLDRRIRIGWVSPLTGSRSADGESDNFNLNLIRRYLERGLAIGGSRYGIDVVVKDSQSAEERAIQVTEDLIDFDRVELVLTMGGGSETVLPVSSTCERRGVPCLSTIGAWNNWVLARDHTFDQPFHWTYHFFWGHRENVSVFIDMWNEMDSNKVVAGLWPDDAGGKEAANRETGYPSKLIPAGYTVVDPGRYENQNNSLAPDFTKLVATITKARPEPDILTGNPLAPDFNEIWTKLNELKWVPPFVTIARGVQLPRNIEALKPTGDGISTSITWHPTFPFRSSLNGMTCKQLAEAYTEQTGRQLTYHNLGLGHAIWEVAIDVLRRAGGSEDREAVVDAMSRTKIDTIGGRIDFTNPARPHHNVSVLPLLGGQWKEGDGHTFDLVIVSNKQLPQIPLTGEFERMRPRF
ncbi:MAG TPA: ABC transporter substrate-binding protein [Actinomycetes bacterium]|nr:ABC transporter substrate-binding protein [Actinomycetes bacterium]